MTQRDALHDADEVVGRITRKGTLDRRYRILYERPEPIRVDPAREVVQILLGVIVILALFAGILMWVAIGQAAQ